MIEVAGVCLKKPTYTIDVSELEKFDGILRCYRNILPVSQKQRSRKLLSKKMLKTKQKKYKQKWKLLSDIRVSDIYVSRK